MLGYASAVVARVREAEQAAGAAADADAGRVGDSGPSTALVLADRAMTVRRQAQQAYPRTRKTRVTYTGNGYASGYREGQKADIGGAKVRSRSGAALSPLTAVRWLAPSRQAAVYWFPRKFAREDRVPADSLRGTPAG